MTTPTPLPHAVAIQMCSDFDEASQSCGDPNHSPESCTCLKLARAWRGMERDLAAAQEARQAAEARAESYKATIDRARRVMGGEGVEDQGQAWDQCLRILDAAIDAAQEKP